jgi:hypothetical protein
MKKLLLSVALFAASSSAFAQVGINTTTPEGTLDVVSENSGIILPRVANINAVTSPVNGMMVYDIFNKCIRFYEGGDWTNCLSGAFIPSVTSPTGKIWMDRNLGASQAATSSTDALSYGDLYQWGRNTDGHEIIYWTSSTASDGMEQNNEIITQSSSPSPGAAFITGSPNWYTGTDPNPDNLWQGESGINNPCPTGYRLPNEAELAAERSAFSTQDAAGAFASLLKLPMAGGRDYSSGALFAVGSFGGYWSSTVSGSNARYLRFLSSSSFILSSERANGLSVRCLKD